MIVLLSWWLGIPTTVIGYQLHPIHIVRKVNRMKDAQYWIDKLDLPKHPEGGNFIKMYRSDEVIDRSRLPERFPGPRILFTSIYFLLPADEYSHFH